LSGASATIGNAFGGLLNGVAGGALQLNAGAFDYRGTGETTAKTINLSGTTGAGIILANQPSRKRLGLQHQRGRSQRCGCQESVPGRQQLLHRW